MTRCGNRPSRTAGIVLFFAYYFAVLAVGFVLGVRYADNDWRRFHDRIG